MSSRTECRAGVMAKTMDPADLKKFHDLRAAGVSWLDLALALRKAGWGRVSPSGLSRHFRGICLCGDVSTPAPDFSFTSVTNR